MDNGLEQLVQGRHARPHDLLGAQPGGLRTWRPEAVHGTLVATGDTLQPLDPRGLFGSDRPPPRTPWTIRWTFADGSTSEEVDPWCFAPETEAEERAAFHDGRHTSAWLLLGAHLRHRDGVDGHRFAVWAPNARRVSVVGDFNDWDGHRHPMTRHDGGIWETFIPEVPPGSLYKFELIDARGQLRIKTDPFARSTEHRPLTASRILPETVYPWSDSAWMASRPRWQTDAISIYEVHPGSWIRTDEGGFVDYHTLARELAEYAGRLGFTHVELLPVMEHPFDGSWGYQCTGWFAPTRRFGEPDAFHAFVDILHRHGIGVVLDWVPGHFPRDDHGLADFDGTALYEYADPQRAHMPDWGTLAFDHGRPEVRSFLVSSAMYWLREFHVDGLRVDAVASMLYLDYAREDDEWTPNIHGGDENLEAIGFLQQLNTVTHGECPDTFTAAEESTAWPGVTRPTYVGGLGFSMKWNMGWMHDTLDYMKRDPVYRCHHQEHLTFGLVYAFSENYILPLSHDEVVHLKGSLLGRMPGDDWQRFANLRLLFAWQFTYPGKKLVFMGGEFGQPSEWDHDRPIDWHCLEQPAHAGVQALVRDLNQLYREQPALHARDFSHNGFAWIDCEDAMNSTIVYRRIGDGEDDEAVIAINFTPVPRHAHRIGLARSGTWREALNTDSAHYGGSGMGNMGRIEAQAEPWMNLPCSAEIVLPPLAAIVLVPEAGHGR